MRFHSFVWSTLAELFFPFSSKASFTTPLFNSSEFVAFDTLAFAFSIALSCLLNIYRYLKANNLNYNKN